MYGKNNKKGFCLLFIRLYVSVILSWKFLRIFFQLVRGAWYVSKLQHPIISIFGSAQTQQSDQYAHEANKLAALFVEKGVSVLTGGGPGIMEAANCGAVLKGGD